MKTKMFFMIMLLLIGAQGNAASVLVGNGIEWTGNVSGIGTHAGTITLNANTSGADFKGGIDAYLAGIELRPVGGDPKKVFTITSISLPNWDFKNARLNRSGATCDGPNGSPSLSKRGCVFAETAADRISTAAGDLAIVLGVELDTAVLPDTVRLRVRWEDLEGKKIGTMIHDEFVSTDLTAVPLPAAAWLFASALAGLAAVARRRDGKFRLLAA